MRSISTQRDNSTRWMWYSSKYHRLLLSYLFTCNIRSEYRLLLYDVYCCTSKLNCCTQRVWYVPRKLVGSSIDSRTKFFFLWNSTSIHTKFELREIIVAPHMPFGCNTCMFVYICLYFSLLYVCKYNKIICFPCCAVYVDTSWGTALQQR